MAEGGGFMSGGGNTGGGRVDEFGNVVPDWGGPNFPTPFVDYNPDEIAGNTERGVDLKGPAAVPTTSKPPGMPSMPGAPPPPQLPQGVSVNDSQSDDAGQSHWSHVPEMPNEPTPMSSQSVIPQMGRGAGQAAQPPMMASGEGPQRRSQSSPAIFSEQRGSQLFGRADGLLGGGKGYAGAQEASGPLEPTEMFKKLLQMFGRQ
ncbi:MAG: hypothetical protein EBS84_22960 [Proteobacteria bacterium]|nr:hypothetical protein [Pseudomonadota bacterium]